LVDGIAFLFQSPDRKEKEKRKKRNTVGGVNVLVKAREVNLLIGTVSNMEKKIGIRREGSRIRDEGNTPAQLPSHNI